MLPSPSHPAQFLSRGPKKKKKLIIAAFTDEARKKAWNVHKNFQKKSKKKKQNFKNR